MKRVSEDSLARSALAKGAVVSIDGKTLNASGARMRLAAPEQVVPLPPLSLPPAPPPVDFSPIERAMSASSERQSQTAEIIATLVREMRAERDSRPAPIVGWEFKVHRDDEDRMTRVSAKAVR